MQLHASFPELQSVWEQTAVRNQAGKARQRLNQGRVDEIKQLEFEVSLAGVGIGFQG